MYRNSIGILLVALALGLTIAVSAQDEYTDLTDEETLSP